MSPDPRAAWFGLLAGERREARTWIMNAVIPSLLPFEWISP